MNPRPDPLPLPMFDLTGHRALVTGARRGIAPRLSDPAHRERTEQRIPLGRLGSPDDLVGAALLLCSDAGSYINGADLVVDGGFSVA